MNIEYNDNTDRMMTVLWKSNGRRQKQIQNDLHILHMRAIGMHDSWEKTLVQNQISELEDEQQEIETKQFAIENWFMENDAKGWLST